MKILACFAVLYTCLEMSSAIPFDLYMNENCGDMNYQLAPDAVLLKYDLYNTYSSCKLVLETTNYGEMFIVKVIKVNFAVDDCSNDYVTIQNGDQSGYILEELCGNYVPESYYVTTDSSLTLDYEVQSNIDNSFQLLITKFTDDDCEDVGKFTCNNGRCIASSLTCDGWNNCGDNSDETQGCMPTTSSPSRDVYMNKHCGETQYIVTPPAIFLRYQQNSDQDSCKIVLETSLIQKFIVKAIDVDFMYPDCGSDYVTIRDGYSSGAILKKFCKTKVPSHAYTTTGLFLTVNYKTTQPGYNNFRLLVTKYTDGPCNEGSGFTCDNGRCIDSTLMCDQWDNCGDNSDETRGCNEIPYMDFTPALIAGITIGSAGLLMLFVTLVVLLVRRRSRRPVQPQPQPPSYGSFTPNYPGYTPVLPSAYEKINSGYDDTGTGKMDVKPRNPSVNP